MFSIKNLDKKNSTYISNFIDKCDSDKLMDEGFNKFNEHINDSKYFTIDLENVFRFFQIKDNHNIVEPVNGCSVQLKVKSIMVYKWMQTFLKIMHPIFKVNDTYNYLNLDDDSFVSFMFEINEIIAQNVDKPTVEGDDSDTIKETIDVIEILEEVKDNIKDAPGSITLAKILNMAMMMITKQLKLLHTFNDMYIKYGLTQTELDNITPSANKYMALINSKPSLATIESIIKIIWEYSFFAQPVTMIQSMVFSLMEIFLIMLSDEIIINHDEDAKHKLTISDLIVNIFTSNLKIYLLKEDDDAWINYASEMICRQNNSSKPILERKKYIVNTLFKRCDKLMASIGFPYKKSCEPNREDAKPSAFINNKLESIFTDLAINGPASKYRHIHHEILDKFTNIENSNYDFIREQLLPYIYLFKIDRLDYIIHNLSSHLLPRCENTKYKDIYAAIKHTLLKINDDGFASSETLQNCIHTDLIIIFMKILKSSSKLLKSNEFDLKNFIETMPLKKKMKVVRR